MFILDLKWRSKLKTTPIHDMEHRTLALSHPNMVNIEYHGSMLEPANKRNIMFSRDLVGDDFEQNRFATKIIRKVEMVLGVVQGGLWSNTNLLICHSQSHPVESI